MGYIYWAKVPNFRVFAETKVWAPFLIVAKTSDEARNSIHTKAGAWHFLLNTFFIHVIVMWPHKKLQQLSFLFRLAACPHWSFTGSRGKTGFYVFFLDGDFFQFIYLVTMTTRNPSVYGCFSLSCILLTKNYQTMCKEIKYTKELKM